MRIGVLALQGAFREHIEILKKLNCETVEVRLPEDLSALNGLIIPGGESTTIGKLANSYDLIESVKAFQNPIWGTCAGAIMLAKEIVNDPAPALGLMDIKIERNAFGRQLESFTADLNINGLTGSAFPAVFIRAPIIKNCNKNAEILAQLDSGEIVAAREGRYLATCFHPELTEDLRMHEYFLFLST